MLASEETGDADAEEADASGANLLASRHAVWNQYVCSKAVEGVQKAERARTLILHVDEKYKGPKRYRTEEGYLWEKYLCTEMHEEHQRLKPAQAGQRAAPKHKAPPGR